MNTDRNNDDWRNPPGLESDELQNIKDILAAQAESRRAISANLLRVVVDGDEKAKINLEETVQVNFDLFDEAELIEVRVVEKDGETILATHLLSFEELEDGSQLQSVLLEGGQKVSFNLKPTKDRYGEVVKINCGVEYTAPERQKSASLAFTNTGFSFSNWFNNLNWAFKPALTFGLILILASIGWLFYRSIGENKQEFVKDNSLPVNQNSEIKIAELPKEQVTDNEKTPEKIVSPANEKQQTKPSIKENTDKKPNLKNEKTAAPKKVIIVKTPTKELQANNNKPESLPDKNNNPNEIWRFPVRGTNDNFDKSEAVRGAIKRGKSLSEVKRIFLDISGSESFDKQIQEQLAAGFIKTGTFTVVPKEKAEARLIIGVRRESNAENNENGTVTVIVRIINAEGFVIYPNRKRVTGWKYIGQAANLPKRIVDDLISAKAAGKSKIKR